MGAALDRGMAASIPGDAFAFGSDGPTQNWVTIAGTTHLLRAVAACGFDAAQLRQRFALPSDEDCSRRIAASTMIELWEAGIELTGRRDIAAIARTQTWTDEVSLLGFVAANQRTIGDAIDVLHRYGATFSDCFSWHIVEDDAHIALRTAPIGPIDRVGWQAYQEFQAIDVVAISQRLCAQMRPVRISFVHPRPEPLGALREIAGVAPEFGAPQQELVYRSSVRSLPITYARPLMAQLFKRRLDTLRSEIAKQPSLASRARAAVARLVSAGDADVSGLARALAMSRRSLERALAAEGVTAAQLFECERKRLALLWLPTMNIDEVAQRIGYASTPAFSRAFRRWTGQSPGAYQRARR
jgi:AraC-like DNA-binding protein